MALSFIFDAGKGETPQSVAQKRALVQQLMGTGAAPKTFGEGLSALGDGIVANVSGRRANEAESKGQAGANDTFSALTAMLTGQGGATPSRGPQTASDATAALAGGDFMSGLINSESGGNWNALNDEGYGGALQFGDARLADAARAGVIPTGVTGAAFSRMSQEQQQAVGAWHFADIEQQAQRMGLDRYYGQTIAGVPITPESVKAMAHLGGIGGVQKFVTSGGQYNPADSNGTRLSDYGQRFGGGGQQAAPAPVQVASLDPSIGMPQAQPAQLPPIGPSGGPQMAAAPQQPGMVPQMPPMQPQAPMAPQQQPMQTAQGPSLQMLMEAAANPWLNEGQRGIVNSMIAQEMQRQDPAYQQQLRAGDLGIQRSELELAAMRNPQRKTTEINGRLVYEDNGELVADYSDPKTATVGNNVIDTRTGQPIYEGQPESPSSVREYDAYAADEIAAGNQPLGRLEYEKAVRSSGATNITNTLGGESLTPGQKKIDEAFAETYLDWNSGGYADADKMMTQLNESLGILESGQDVTGAIGLLPDQLRPFLNEQGAIAKENVEEVVQRSLREILGAQFTEKEGERLIARAFNDKLPPAENAKRVRRLIDTIQGMAHSKQAMVDYWDEMGTLRGYKGPRPNRSQLDNLDFGDAAGGPAGAAPPSPAAAGEPTAEFLKWSGDPDLWNFMTPEQRALW